MLQEDVFDSPETPGGEGGYLGFGSGGGCDKTFKFAYEISRNWQMIITYWKTWLHDNGRGRRWEKQRKFSAFPASRLGLEEGQPQRINNPIFAGG